MSRDEYEQKMAEAKAEFDAWDLARNRRRALFTAVLEKVGPSTTIVWHV